jgi:hypothetical protein
MRNIVLSERQKPRVLQSMKDIYAAHSAECAAGVRCCVMVALKRDIEALEHELSPAPAAKRRSAGVK